MRDVDRIRITKVYTSCPGWPSGGVIRALQPNINIYDVPPACRSPLRTEAGRQWWAKWRLSTFDLYLWGEGHGVQGQIYDILRPQLVMNRFLPLWPHRFLHFWFIHLGGGGVGGALILDRCRAFDLFASVDAHLCWPGRYMRMDSPLKGPKHEIFESGFFYTNQRLMVKWVGDWQKKLKFRKLESLF